MNRCRRVLLLPWDAEGDGSATGLTWAELPASCWEQGMCPAMLRTSVLCECPHPSLPSWGLMLFAFTHMVIVGCIPSILQGRGLQDATAQPGSSGRGRTRRHHPWLPRVHRAPGSSEPQHRAEVPGVPSVPTGGAGAVPCPPGTAHPPWPGRWLFLRNGRAASGKQE